MSSILAESFRFSDYRAWKVNISFDYAESHDSISVSFRCNEDNLDVISTSVGRITDNQVFMKPVHEALMYVDYCNSNSIQCVIGYYSDNKLLFNDILVATLDSHPQIQDTDPGIRSVAVDSTSFESKIQDFINSLKTMTSNWSVKMNYAGHIALSVEKTGTESIVVSLGEVSDDLRASDYLFSIDPGISTINIPEEIVWKIKKSIVDSSDQYSSKRIAVCELVTPDFIKSQCFYKVPISNTILLSEIH